MRSSSYSNIRFPQFGTHKTWKPLLKQVYETLRRNSEGEMTVAKRGRKGLTLTHDKVQQLERLRSQYLQYIVTFIPERCATILETKSPLASGGRLITTLDQRLSDSRSSVRDLRNLAVSIVVSIVSVPSIIGSYFALIHIEVTIPSINQ